MILFVINNRTRHYGYLPFNCVRDLSQDEFHAWVKENLGPPSSCRISSRGLNKSDLVADSSRSIEHSNTNADTPKFDYTPPENAKWHIEPETSTTMKCLPDEGGWVWDDEVSELVENQRRKIGGSEWIAKRIRPGGQ